MSDATTSYKCPSCGASLQFSASDGELKCGACGNTYKTETLRILSESDENKVEFDWGDYKTAFGDGEEKLDNTVIYVCRSCGAAIETDETTAATHCPYCDNEIVISDRLTGGLKPNAIIPFKLDKKGLAEKVKEYTKGKRLLPNNFFSEYKMSKIQGVYVPFWLFDAGLDGEMAFDATKVRYYSDSNYDYTKTDHYLINMDGEMKFAKVPVDGSVKMDDDLMDSIEPYNYSELVDFDPSYLSGFLADRFDDDPDKSLPRASKRMMQSAADAFISKIGERYQSSHLRTNRMQITEASVKYVLLPVYLLNLKYGGKNYRFAVNGQTGKIVGELPISKAKKRLYFWGVTAIVTAIVSFIAFLIFK